MPNEPTNPFTFPPSADRRGSDRPVVPDVEERPALTARGITLGISFLATVLLVCGLAVVPTPYVVKSPGPTVDTLSAVDGEALITVDGAETYESSGELRLTTVGVTGGPDYPTTIVHVVRGWFDGTEAVAPVETAFAPGITQEEADQQSNLQMRQSQESAAYAALAELGYDIPVEVVVEDLVDGSPAQGHLQQADVLVALGGASIGDQQQLFDILGGTAPGTPLTVGVRRDGEILEETVVTAGPEGDDDAEGSRLGILISSEFDLPVDVSIALEDIGGPSAGMMFSLGIIDLLTPQDEVAGQVIAGTGTMDMEGAVGPIGGIRQKLHGALRDGATWFLAPAGNCNEVYGNVPVGLRVVKVGTLGEAREAMTAIGAGTGADLPTCTADDARTAANR